MSNKWMNVASLAVLISCSSLCRSQALPSATARGALQAGIGWSYVNSDYDSKAIQGITAFADYDFHPNLGIEAEFHYIALITPQDNAEESFFIGPRYILRRGRFNYYAKALVGEGTFVIQNPADNHELGAGTYLAYGIGAGVDYRLTRHFIARGDFEYQHWSYANGLTPTAYTVGVAYRFR